jgi:hypothetical protein
MVEVTIVCLIYKSKKLAKAIYDSLYKYTPKLRNGEAELLFVANDPTIELVKFLDSQGYPYIINANKHLSEKELFEIGCGKPEYMRRVYQGYNQGILHAKGQKVLLINSDNFFSEDWLENLLKYSDYKKVVCSTLVEPGHDKFGVYPCAVHKNFGRTIEEYKEKEFQKFVAKISKTGYTSGGAYMPCLLYKDIAVMAGLYPQGNIAGKKFDDITCYGDEYFYQKLKSFGVEHITAKDSVVYHLKEGEKSEDSEDTTIVDDAKYQYFSIIDKYKVKPTNLLNYIKPEAGHLEIMETLGRKFTAIIMHFWSLEELQSQIDQVASQVVKNIEIIVIYSDKELVKDKHENVKYIHATNEMRYAVIYDLLHKMYGEYLVILNPRGVYTSDLFEKIVDKNAIYHISNEVDNNEELIDSVGNFVIAKNILLNDINTFMGSILSNGDLKLNLKKQKVIKIPLVRAVADIEEQYIPGYKKSIPYKTLRKIYREGLRSTAGAVLYQIRRKK